MRGSDNRRENQHYVPKLLLRNFASNRAAKSGTEKIWVFDKTDSSFFQTNIRNVAAENEFYDIGEGENRSSIEDTLSDLERGVARTFSRMIKERSLRNLSPEGRAWVAVFSAVQHVRGRSFRETISWFDEALKKKIQQLGGDVNKVENYRPLNGEEGKEFSMSFVLSAAINFSPYFADKFWLLLETSLDDPFFVGDNPIALHNEKEMRPYGNLGLAVSGIEIYLPLTPTLTLAFWDSAVVHLLSSRIAKAREARAEAMKTAPISFTPAADSSATRIIREFDSGLEKTERLLQAATHGGIANCEAEVVMFLNSLQVIYASRFVMSAENNFSLATRMLNEKPHLRQPHLPELA